MQCDVRLARMRRPIQSAFTLQNKSKSRFRWRRRCCFARSLTVVTRTTLDRNTMGG